MTNLRTACTASNRETHGARWAFDYQLAKYLKAGWAPSTAFALTCNAVFHRYIGK